MKYVETFKNNLFQNHMKVMWDIHNSDSNNVDDNNITVIDPHIGKKVSMYMDSEQQWQKSIASALDENWWVEAKVSGYKDTDMYRLVKMHKYKGFVQRKVKLVEKVKTTSEEMEGKNVSLYLPPPPQDLSGVKITVV